MKSPFHLMQLAAFFLATILLAGCGQKGPLYIPAKPAPAPAPAAVKTAPANPSAAAPVSQ